MALQSPVITSTGHLADKLADVPNYSPHYQLEVPSHVPPDLGYLSDLADSLCSTSFPYRLAVEE